MIGEVLANNKICFTGKNKHTYCSDLVYAPLQKAWNTNSGAIRNIVHRFYKSNSPPLVTKKRFIETGPIELEAPAPAEVALPEQAPTEVLGQAPTVLEEPVPVPGPVEYSKLQNMNHDSHWNRQLNKQALEQAPAKITEPMPTLIPLSGKLGRRLANQDQIDRFIRASLYCQTS